MSRSLTSPGLKRKRPDSDQPDLTVTDSKVLNAIRSKGDSGIWLRDIKVETKLVDPAVNKSLKSLMSKDLIKEVVNIQNKGKKHYMAAEFKPSRELTGGEWYADGKLNQSLIEDLKKRCSDCLRVCKVVTLEGVRKSVSKALDYEVSTQRVGEILNSMVLDNDVIEVKSTGLGDYHSIPIGAVCYRVASGLAKGARTGAFASIPCGACPRISMCAPDGIISPSTCVYYKKWLGLDF